MDLWIEHACEAERLLLCWEAPVTQKDRNRWVVGAVERVGESITRSHKSKTRICLDGFRVPRDRLPRTHLENSNQLGQMDLHIQSG